MLLGRSGQQQSVSCLSSNLQTLLDVLLGIGVVFLQLPPIHLFSSGVAFLLDPLEKF